MSASATFEFSKVPSLAPLLSNQVKEIVRNFPRQKAFHRLYLFGSAARGEATFRSDLDLAVIINTSPTASLVGRLRDEIESALGTGSKTWNEPLACQFQFISANRESNFAEDAKPLILLINFDEMKP